MDTHPIFGSGFGVALTTPFVPGGEVDTASLAQLTRHVVQGGADFVVALGSTGEASMLDERERELVIKTIRENCGTARLVIGTGASSTAQACSWTRAAISAGAHAALVAVPPYTKPTQAGVHAHFARIADIADSLPLIAYNVPSRTGTNLLPETLQQLWTIPNVVAVKESSGDLLQISRIGANLPDGRLLLAGDDVMMLPTIAVGGHGVVSVAGNVVPNEMRELLDACRASDLPRAQSRLAALLPLFEALGLEPNPITIKAALAIAGFGDATPRLPLLPAEPATNGALRQALQHLQETTTHA